MIECFFLELNQVILYYYVHLLTIQCVAHFYDLDKKEFDKIKYSFDTTQDYGYVKYNIIS